MNPDRLRCREAGKRHPDWHRLYEQENVETLPWFEAALDRDLESALRASPARGTFLDLGTGPGTQAAQLARLGFSVVGTDFSEAAVREARRRFTDLRFEVDDILETKIYERFDFVLDRGLFHVLDPRDHARYARSVATLTRGGGTFYLKCFSTEQPPADFGPLRFRAADLERLFTPYFDLSEVKATHYGNSPRSPRALFLTFRRRPSARPDRLTVERVYTACTRRAPEPVK